MNAKQDNLAIQISITSADESIQFKVVDNGPGIAPSSLNKVFEPFYTTKPQGTGLGLAVVQAVIKTHKGEFKVSSNKQGVTAIVVLPAYLSHQFKDSSENKHNNSDVSHSDK